MRTGIDDGGLFPVLLRTHMHGLHFMLRAWLLDSPLLCDDDGQPQGNQQYNPNPNPNPHPNPNPSSHSIRNPVPIPDPDPDPDPNSNLK